MNNDFDLAVSWDWELDKEFVDILESEIQKRELRFYSISHHNTHETVRRVQKGEVSFGAFLDRAGDADEVFLAVSRALKKTRTLFINNPEALSRAIDKATMHLEFITAGVNVPFTIIISPYTKKRELELSLTDLAQLGRPFIIKPANTTGGGVGVVTGAESLKDIIESRQHHKNDKYLLQEKIIPIDLEGRKAWFRVFWVFDRPIACWWDDATHIYARVDPDEVERYGLHELEQVTKGIARVCGLQFFSTEIAVTSERKFVVVDYVNDICDMRLQSRHPDGVPDRTVTEISAHIAGRLREFLSSGTSVTPE